MYEPSKLPEVEVKPAPLSSDEIRVNSIFIEAKRLLQERGWCQGAGENERGEVCLGRAITYGWRSMREPQWLAGAGGIIFSQIQGAIAFQIADVPAWNDEPGRTLDQVLAVLDRAMF